MKSPIPWHEKHTLTELYSLLDKWLESRPRLKPQAAAMKTEIKRRYDLERGKK